jgi:hypothetical protein
VSTIVESAQHFVESVTTAVESVLDTSSVLVLPPQEDNTVTTPIAKIKFFIFVLFLFL